VDRREAVRLLGAIVAVPFLPGTAGSAAVHADRVHEAIQGGARFRTFDPAQQELVGRLVDAIIPRTDTPGALDVRVPEFIDHVVTDWASEPERRALLDGLAAIDARARAHGAATFAGLPATRQADLLRTLDAERAATSGAGHAFGHVKSLAVYGYFTAEAVQRDVLKTQMFFAAFDGCAPS
jgi:gluconate 2-dehydrogenase gamma chain